MGTTAIAGADVVALRRDLHRRPELGFLEYGTAARVCVELADIPGCELRVGAAVMDPAARMGAPDADACAAARAEALAAGADAGWVASLGDGLTGVVAEWRFARPGPVLALRFDMDALPVREREDDGHRPAREGFASQAPGRMHACGHDGHTAIGVALGTRVPALAERWGGTLRLIFQPAEEGSRGARAMVAAGVTDDVDLLVCGHLGVAATRTGLIACGTDGWLATTKLDVTFTGRAAHAGVAPQAGRDALLAAATCALGLHALPRHGDGASRVNVGVLEAGSARNVVPAHARMQVEVRGSTSAINADMETAARRVIAAAAAMHGVEATIEPAGAAGGADSDAALRAHVRAAASGLAGVTEIAETLPSGGSEDATLLMEAVQARGGQATYLLIGSDLPAGHHEDGFDVDDAALELGVELHAALVDRLLGGAGGRTANDDEQETAAR